MFDIGWLELIIIGVVALIVVGPKDLPGMFRTVGRFMGKARGMAREFQRSMEEAADETGLKEAASGLKDIDNLGLNSATKSAQNYAKNFAMGESGSEADTSKPDKPKVEGKPATPKAKKKPAAPKAETPAPEPEKS